MENQADDNEDDDNIKHNTFNYQLEGIEFDCFALLGFCVNICFITQIILCRLVGYIALTTFLFIQHLSLRYAVSWELKE